MIVAKYFVLVIVSRPSYNSLIQNIVYLLCVLLFLFKQTILSLSQGVYASFAKIFNC